MNGCDCLVNLYQYEFRGRRSRRIGKSFGPDFLKVVKVIQFILNRLGLLNQCLKPSGKNELQSLPLLLLVLEYRERGLMTENKVRCCRFPVNLGGDIGK